MSQTVLKPDANDSSLGGGRWMVTIFNNETNSMEEVIGILMKATACDAEEASIEMWEAHTFGKSHVHFASIEECRIAAEIISSIGVRTEVSPEWSD